MWNFSSTRNGGQLSTNVDNWLNSEDTILCLVLRAIFTRLDELNDATEFG